MRLLTPLFILLFTSSLYGKNLNIQECLELIDFEPYKYAYGDFSLDGLVPEVDLKNGYYEIYDPNSETTYIQATKFNNTDGSVTLMITGFESDHVCTRYNTWSYLIFPDGEKYIEMGTDELNITTDFASFLDNPELTTTLTKLLQELKGGYLSEDDQIDQMYLELFDFHYVLPQKGTSLTITVTICDYIPTNEIEISEEDWSIIENSILSRSFDYDKKFIRFK